MAKPTLLQWDQPDSVHKCLGLPPPLAVHPTRGLVVFVCFPATSHLLISDSAATGADGLNMLTDRAACATEATCPPGQMREAGTVQSGVQVQQGARVNPRFPWVTLGAKLRSQSC